MRACAGVPQVVRRADDHGRDFFTGGNTMRYAICILCMMFFSVTSATAQVSVGIGLPGLSIGINMPVYPAFVRVPNYPVYYAPGASSNYF
ncbi:MAG: hypothetical protein WCA24_11705, partial [Thiomonas sp.]